MKKPTQEAAAHSRDSRAQITPVHVRLDAMVNSLQMVHTELTAVIWAVAMLWEVLQWAFNTSSLHLLSDSGFLSRGRETSKLSTDQTNHLCEQVADFDMWPWKQEMCSPIFINGSLTQVEEKNHRQEKNQGNKDLQLWHHQAVIL